MSFKVIKLGSLQPKKSKVKRRHFRVLQKCVKRKQILSIQRTCFILHSTSTGVNLGSSFQDTSAGRGGHGKIRSFSQLYHISACKQSYAFGFIALLLLQLYFLCAKQVALVISAEKSFQPAAQYTGFIWKMVNWCSVPKMRIWISRSHTTFLIHSLIFTCI